MAYPRKLLNDGEEIRVEVMPHWSMLFRPAVVSVAGLLLLVIAAGAGGGPWTLVAAVVWALCLGWLGIVWLVRSTTEVVVTTDRLISRTGVFAKTGIEIPLERVNNIMFRQTVVERLLGSGDLLVESAGESGQQRFTDIPRPSWVQNQIYRAMEEAQVRDDERRFGWMRYSVADELTKLDELRRRGVITDDEFDAQKRQLLGSGDGQ